MSIITISRAFCSKGTQLAELIAEQLHYTCVSREILLEASDQFNIPEIILTKAIHDGPTIFDKFTHGKQRYIAFIRSALLDFLKKDNMVYHGLAGHFFLQGLPHVLKVRTIADMDVRIREEMEKENISELMARKRLMNDDKNRHNFGMYLYGVDTYDPDLFDLVINLRDMSLNDCADIVCHTATRPSFTTTEESLERLSDLALAAKVYALIIDKYFNSSVHSHEGNVSIQMNDQLAKPEKIRKDVEKLIKNVQEVKKISISVKTSSLRTAMHK
ncbi:MAG: cytidylate kinase-like family protein [Proteobacteria bacterium]|nr:cytidylate kinase-like family protein [Pseudomonadota bacterium]